MSADMVVTLALWGTAVAAAGFMVAGVLALVVDRRPRRYRGRHRAWL